MQNAIRELLPETLEWSPGGQNEVLPKLPAKPGVWLLLAEGDIPLLAATSQKMRAVVTGRLTTPDPTQRTRKTDLSRTAVACRYAVTYGRFESDWLYGKLVHMAWPEEFWDRVGFAPMWMLQAYPVLTPHTAAGGGIMRLQPTTSWPEQPGTIALGPLATRGDAQDLSDLLIDLFDLCRYWPILAKAPHGTPCAYHEMGRSRAPCAGRIPMEQYNQTVREAMALAGRDRVRIVQARQDEMKAAAATLQFEQAGRLKSWLQRVAVLNEPRFRYLDDVSGLVGLAISRFRAQARPFFFWAGTIEAGEAVKLSRTEEHLPPWRDRLKAGPASDAPPSIRRWQSGLLTTHLFRPERKDLIWLPADADPSVWLDIVRQEPPTPATEQS